MAVDSLLDMEITGMVGSIRGQKIYLYGSNDTGKTKQSMKLLKPFLLMVENGGNGVKGYKKPIVRWAQFKNYVAQLTSEQKVDDPENKGTKIPMFELMQRKINTVVIDTVEDLVELAEKAVCKEFGVRDISEITGKQNGYKIYRSDFKEQINLLCSYGYTVVFIGHEEQIEKTDVVTGEKYLFIQPQGTSNEKASTRFVRDLCDFCFYLKDNGIDENGDSIWSTAICKRTKHVFARSRYAIKTFIDPFTAKNLEEAIVQAIEKTAEDEDAVLSDWKKTYDNYTKEDWIDMIKPYFKAIHKKYPEKVAEIIAYELGEGAKISQATDEQLAELENIYNQFVTFACNMGIVVEIE